MKKRAGIYVEDVRPGTVIVRDFEFGLGVHLIVSKTSEELLILKLYAGNLTIDKRSSELRPLYYMTYVVFDA